MRHIHDAEEVSVSQQLYIVVWRGSGRCHIAELDTLCLAAYLHWATVTGEQAHKLSERFGATKTTKNRGLVKTGDNEQLGV